MVRKIIATGIVGCCFWIGIAAAATVQWEEQPDGGRLLIRDVEPSTIARSDAPWLVKQEDTVRYFRFLIALPSEQFALQIEQWSAVPVRDEVVIPRNIQRSSTPVVHTTPLGWQRGRFILALTVVPFVYDSTAYQWQLLHTLKLRMRFSSQQRTKFPKALLEKPLFAGVINAEQAVRFEPTAQVLDSDSLPPLPFPKGRLAVKLRTSKDGVAFVPFESVVSVLPAFRNQDFAHLHLYYRARPVPYTIIGDQDGQFNEGDTLIFQGFHPSGDTVWFSSYDTHTAFFLVIDSSQVSQRFGEWGSVSIQDTVRKIWITEHFEEDHYVSVGFKDHVTGDEDWSWTGGIHWGKGFTYPVRLYPADSLIFRCQYRAISDNRHYKPDHYPQFLVNDTVVAETMFDGRRDDTLEAVLPATQVLMGPNRLRFYSAGVPEYRDRKDPPYTDLMYLDYFEVEGWSLPVLSNEMVRGEVRGLAKPAALMLYGATTLPIVILDTIHRQYAVVRDAESGVQIAASCHRRTTLVINGEVLVDTLSGGWAVVVSAAAPTVVQLFDLQQQTASFEQAVTNAPSRSVIAVVWNTQSELPETVRTVLQALGATAITSYTAGERYALIAQKDEAIVEERRGVAPFGLSQFVPLPGASSYRVILPVATGATWFVAASPPAWEEAKVEPVKLHYWRDYRGQVDYLVIAHSKFWSQAQQLAQYRAQRSGVSALVVDVESLYDEFSYGEKNPYAIKWFFKAAFQRWQRPAPTYAVFFGDASWDPRKVWKKSVKEDYVPSYGKPVSDYWYTLLDPSPDILPELLTGRIPVETEEEAQAVVDKIIEYESLPQQPWMRHALFLTGGENQNERFLFRFDAEQVVGSYLYQAPLCMTAEIISKASDGNVDNSNATLIRRAIDKGAMWVNYVGHAAPTIFDMDFGWAKDFNNTGKYPILATFSCQTGAFAEPTVVAKNEDFLRGERRGMIACYGTTGFGYVAIDRELLRGFFEGFRDSVAHFGDLLQYAKMWTLVVSDTLNPWTMGEEKRTTFWQYTLLGDPMGVIAYRPKVDPYVLETDFTIVNAQGEATFAEEDTVVFLRGMIRNGGQWWRDSLQIRIVHSAEQWRDTLWFTVPELCADRPFFAAIPTYGITGVHTLEVQVDPGHRIDEANPLNNTVQLSFTVFSNRLSPLDPLPYWNIASDRPRFRVLRPFGKAIVATEWLLRDPYTDSIIVSAAPEEVEIDPDVLEWQCPKRLEKGKSYVLWVRAWEEGQSLPGEWLTIPFFVDSVGAQQPMVRWRVQSSAEWRAVQRGQWRWLPDSAGVKLSNRKVPLEVYSDGRGKTRRVRVRIAGQEYLNSPFKRGFNVFVIPPDDSVRSVYRRYDTYLKEAPIQKDVYGDSEELVRFLEDSVRAEDRILIALCDNSVRGILQKGPDEPGNFTDVVRALQRYGAEYAESLRYGSSYILLAKRGQKLRELWKREQPEGNTAVELNDSLEVWVRSGQLTLPPLLQIKQVQQIVLHTNGEGRYQMQVIQQKDNDSLQVLWEVDSTVATFPGLPPSQTYQLRIRVDKFENETPTIYGVEVRYVPLPELSVRVLERRDSIVQGFVGTVVVRTRNLSLRSAADSCLVQVNVHPVENGGAGVEVQHRYENIGPNQEVVDTFAIATLPLESENRLEVQGIVLPAEMYLWNNRAIDRYVVQLDTVPPTVRLLVDSLQWDSLRIVRQQPRIAVEVWDNSPQPIQPAQVTIVLNGMPLEQYPDSVLQRTVTTQSPDPAQIASSVHLLDLHFTAPLQIGVNTLWIVAEDYFGNRDTVHYQLVVPETFRVAEAVVYPNPASGRVTLRLKIEDHRVPQQATLQVYDVFGQLLLRQSIQLHVGENLLMWNGRDSRGALVANGTYFLVLTLETSQGQQLLRYPVQMLR